jgi:hypothetical protein
MKLSFSPKRSSLVDIYTLLRKKVSVYMLAIDEVFGWALSEGLPWSKTLL